MAQSVRPIKFDESTRVGVSPPENDRGRFGSLIRKELVISREGHVLTACCPLKRDPLVLDVRLNNFVEVCFRFEPQ